METNGPLFPKGFERLSEKEKLNIGRIEIPRHFVKSASQRIAVVNVWIPRLIWTNYFLLGVSFLIFLVTLLSILGRTNPIILVTFPDGSTLCAPLPVDPETKQVIPRTNPEEVTLCRRLSNYQEE